MSGEGWSGCCYDRRVADQELKWWRVRWRLAARAIYRPAIILGKVIAAICLVAAIGYGVIYLIKPWLVPQGMRRVYPRVSMVPVALPNRAEAPLSGARIDRCGFRIALPKEEITRTIHSDSVTVVVFRDGGDMMINNTARNPGILGIAMRDKRMQRLFEQEKIYSEFQLLRAAMWATPEQTKWWRFRTLKNQTLEYLLLMKSS